MPRRRPLALLAVWAAGALVATGTGLLAVQQVAVGVSDGVPPPLSAAGVETALAQATATASTAPRPTTPDDVGATPATSTPAVVVPEPSAPTPPAAAPQQGPPVSRSFTGAGGSVGVSCQDGVARLLYVTPAQGYRVDDRREDVERVEVRFRDDEGGDQRLRVVCAAAGPVEQA